jgi:hypothetical protein
MPSYLDFNTTKQFRNHILGKTLQQPNGPQTFTNSSYVQQNLSDIPNLLQGEVDTNRINDLTIPKNSNIYKPDEYFIGEIINTLPRSVNLKLYPGFVQTDLSLFGIISNSNYETESELVKFSTNLIKNDPQGPVYSRIAQNVEKNTLGRVRIMDAFNGNTTTAINIITGREPLIESNYKITVDNTLSIPGNAVDFLKTVSGVQLPFSQIPGDYLSNPRNPINYRPQASSQLGALYQDVTGVLGSLIGIQRRPLLSRKPSDLLIEHMGSGQKNRLYDLLSYSTYAPNYTTTARSQNTSKIFNFVDKVAQGIKNILGVEAPAGTAYIGDDRGNDVKYAMNDFNDRPVRSNYYLTLMFDEVSAKLFHTNKNITEGGSVGGKLSWISKNSKNKLGVNNNSWETGASLFTESLSTKNKFREDSILGITQELLDSMPSDGGAARSHIANVIDQTSRVFQDGDTRISRGSAVKYTDKFTGEESGVEYARVWTKDRPYMTNFDTMPLATNQKDINTKKYKQAGRKYRRGNIRRFNSSVLDDTWNLNMAPMSNGKKSFDGSTNIVEKNVGNGDFYAKKYMLSIENLAWKTSNLKGFQVSDLPACERGNNGGRVMWFPPYDLKVSEQNSATWEKNSFVGRPEPIYTYQNTERTGQVSFKVVVDHPSIMNLLVREHFKGMSDEESDNYINAFFAGAQDVDFYSLIQTYTTLDSNDRQLIEQYLNAGIEKQSITNVKFTSDPLPADGGDTDNNKFTNVEWNTKNTFYFENDIPSKQGNSLTISDGDYGSQVTTYSGQQSTFITNLTSVMSGNTLTSSDKLLLIGSTGSTSTPSVISEIISGITSGFTEIGVNFTELNKQLDDLKTVLSGKTIVGDAEIQILTTTSEAGDENKNFYLGIRRIHSLLLYIDTYLTKTTTPSSIQIEPASVLKYVKDGLPFDTIPISKKFKDFGYDVDGQIKFNISTYGENFVLNNAGGQTNVDCSKSFSEPLLRRYAPTSFYCREGKVKIKYTKSEGEKTVQKINVPITKLVVSKDTIDITKKKPSIDVMKRIIMKTLSECHYFKKLEEDSPIAFKSLTEKLKYFHPAFHSTTPEGLNSRLTFLLQCLRPGDTIPIKGLSDNNDIGARNTSFGPPPICVLRIGDFYHSKIIIKDINITYDDGVWDFNPEGIGVQPMIANVQLQVNFIGGQGLDRPVEKLQNALSSNFFANTEMYDERSIPTDGRIGYENKDKFTKEFLETLKNLDTAKTASIPSDPNKIVQGTYIGVGSGTKLVYTTIVDDLYKRADNYTNMYKSVYESIYKTYGPKVTGLFFSPDYRTINELNINIEEGDVINMLGEYSGNNNLSFYSNAFKNTLTYSITTLPTNELMDMLGFEMGGGDESKEAEDIIKPIINKIVSDIIDEFPTLKSIKDLEKSRKEFVNVIDKLNYIAINSEDTKIVDTTLVKTPLTGFNQSGFTSNYNVVIDYLRSFDLKTTSLFNPPIDFNTVYLESATISNEDIKSILQVFLIGHKSDIVDPLVNRWIGDELLQYTTQNFYEKFDLFVNSNNTTTLTIDVAPIRSNGTPIEYETSPSTEVPDIEKTDDIFKIFSSKNNLGDTLNFYR